MAGSILTSSTAKSIPVSGGHRQVESVGHHSAAQADPWIFRDGKKNVSGAEMLRDLYNRIAGAGEAGSVIDALIEAGQLESALADADSLFADVASELTDTLAFALCSGTCNVEEALSLLSRIPPPARLCFSPPEGFTYYALHPLDFANVTAHIPNEPRSCALIGIRSIGTTLSAVSAAALRKSRRDACRITVRPTGHPYARKTEFTPLQKGWIRSQFTKGAQFLIVDEGPGRSGSTFLSVAEALFDVGVPRNLITILGSREPEPASLCADDAVARWNAFHFMATVPSVNTRFAGFAYAGGGNWRQLTNLQPWPESWTQMERLKFLAPDHTTLFKFEGMGPLGAQVRERAFVLAKAGMGPQVAETGDGFLEYEWLDGRPLCRDALTMPMLERLAAYCACRVSHFPAPHSDPSELRRMLEFNVQNEFGVELDLPDDVFATSAPVLADGRMQPHEWIAVADGNIVKTDGISHGDDHFFPGPCDIAWDLAGIVIEWRLDPSGQDSLLREFRRRSGVNKTSIRDYILAYAVFRLGFCKMAMSTVRGTPEEQRLLSAYERYRSQAEYELATRMTHREACL